MGADVGGEGARGVGKAVAVFRRLMQAGDQRAADDDAVGKVRHAAGSHAVADAEADADGQAGVGFEGADVGGDGVGIGPFGAGHAAQRDEVEEAARVLHDGAAACGVGGRGNQQNGSDTALVEVGFVVGQGFDRAIDEDDGITACGGKVAHHLGKTCALEAVEVAHEDERGGRVVAAEFAHDGKRLLQGDAARQRPFVGLLDGLTVGGGVGKGDAEFEGVCTAGDKGMEDGGGLCRVGVARADVGDECFALLRVQRGEAVRESGHGCLTG